jgi:hypothetical protein
MKAHDLRVGNLFRDRSGKVLRLDFWDNMKPAQRVFIEGQEVHPLTEDLEYCQPIPLTEEWLLKFGFEKNHNNQFILMKGSVDILFNKDLNGWTCDGMNFSINQTLYVNQLQNLYFALTGLELTHEH